MPKALEAQRDFSAGEIDPSAKRSDQSAEIAPLLKAGVRQALNMRIRNSKALRNRPGRSVLFLEAGRVEKVLMSPGNYFYLVFGNGYLRVYDASGAQVFTSSLKGDGVTPIPWTTATVKSVVWANIGLSIYITYADGAPANVPQILTWDGVSTWALTTFAETVTAGSQKRTPFYRLSPHGITMAPSSNTGVITLVMSSAVFVAGHVNTRMRFCGRQVLITAVANSTHATATVQESLPVGQTLQVVAGPGGLINVGDEIVGSVSGAKGIVTSIGVGTLNVQLLQVNSNAATSQGITSVTFGFVLSETISGPGGSTAIGNVAGNVANIAPQAVTVWDDEVMNTFRGFPKSCFADQSRLGLCNIPSLPQAISWSAIITPSDLYVSGLPSEAMFELAPDKVQIYHVLAGPESSEFVFANRKIYYIPISVTNPLEPGRVAFNILSSSGALPVQPRLVDEDVVYVDSQNTINSITAPGMYYRPYGVRNLTEVSTHLIKNPIAIAVPTQQGTFAESYIYVLNPDGTIAVGKYETENGQIKGVVGWTPWSGAGAVSWIGATDEAVIFTTVYPGANVVEALDDTVYLDAGMFVNAAPAALAPPGGKGPLWWIAGQTADLMDQATRMMGTYQIDANGFIVPQNNGGENLAAASLVAGQFFELLVEPFLPAAPPGPDSHQRMTRRRIARLGVHVSRSTGFVFAKIASRIGPLLPAVGSLTFIRRVTTWNQDDDPTKAPVLRETAYNTRVTGRDYDPRVAIVKDTPGPLEILEIGMEAGT